MPIDRLKSHASRCALFLALAFAALPTAGAEVDRIASFSGGVPNLGDGGPDIAVQPGGSFLLTWQLIDSVGIPRVRAQRFDAAGRPLAPVAELWEGIDPQVASLPDGGFVATSWFDRSLFPLAPPGIGLHRLDALGGPVGEPIAVTFDPNFQPNVDSRLAVAPHGVVAIVWRETPINFDAPLAVYGRFYNSALEPMIDAVLLSSDSANPFQFSPDIAFRADGAGLAVWAAGGDGTLGPQIFGRLFDVSGHPLSATFPVNLPEPQRVSQSPRVVADADGGWWVGWNSVPLPAGDIEARVLRLGAGGERLGNALSLGAPLAKNGTLALGIGSAGKLLVAGRTADGSISARLFDRDGTHPTDLFTLSEGDPLSNTAAALGDRSSGGFLAAWPTASDITGAILTPVCLDGKNAACFGPDGRYGVEVAWQLGAQSGTAKPLPLAGNAATFGLRNAADHDVTVLLSGPGSRDLTFAATTGAALEIRVTDKTTGAIRTFSKPAGRFASRRIPNALPGRSSGSDDPATAVFLASDTTEVGALEIRPSVGETCAPTSRALCLLGSRFRAELFGGQSARPALALLRTDRSGAFAFPSAPETPLVTLTMIDGRASNGKFWVYLGGLSAAGYKVKITDLSTGVAKTYSNPAGRIESRADRNAF